MSQANPSFPGRNVYASSSKLPDRTALQKGGAAAQPYSQSSLGRRPDQPYQFGQSTAAQQHGGLGPRSNMEKEPNALSELSEEQRDEINEAVCAACSLFFYNVTDTQMTSSPCLTSIEIVIWTTTNFELPCDHWDSPFPNPKSLK